MGVGRAARIGRVARCGQGGLGVPPVLQSATILSGGTTLRLVFDRAIDAGDPNDGTGSGMGLFLHASGGDLNGANADIATTVPIANVSTANYDSLIRTIAPGETLTLDYSTQSVVINSILSHADHTQLAPLSGIPVTNNA